jgi:D-3-phosphoglycerate dehydrogenase
MKILITDAIEQQCVDILKADNLEVTLSPGLEPEQIKKIIPDYDGLIVRSGTTVTSDIIAAGAKLKVVGRAGAGVDNIDVEAATRKGIIVMNTPGGNTISTAEHTISMMLALARNIPQADQSLKRGEWNRKKFIGMELYEKTLGIVGLGKVGREVAKRCASFGMKIIAFDPVLSPDSITEKWIELVPLVELLKRSDVITVHTPLTNETRGLIGKGAFKMCKPGVRIVNCARGGIVDEGALLEALNTGVVGGAALDVFSTEPPGDHPLLRQPNVIATPHLGASTGEAQEKVAAQIARQVSDALYRRRVTGSVNADAIGSAMRPELRPFLSLAEKLGMLVVQLWNGQVKHLTLRIQGELMNGSSDILCAAFLKGIFSQLLEEPVNYLNAPMIAHERRIHVDVVKEQGHDVNANLLTAMYETDKEKRSFSGTVFGQNSIRLVNIDGFHFEANPAGRLLFYSNIDKPGVVAAISSILSKASINIAGMSLGRYGIGKEALTVMSIDEEIPDTILAEISAVKGLLGVKTVFLGD